MTIITDESILPVEKRKIFGVETKCEYYIKEKPRAKYFLAYKNGSLITLNSTQFKRYFPDADLSCTKKPPKKPIKKPDNKMFSNEKASFLDKKPFLSYSDRSSIISDTLHASGYPYVLDGQEYYEDTKFKIFGEFETNGLVTYMNVIRAAFKGFKYRVHVKGLKRIKSTGSLKIVEVKRYLSEHSVKRLLRIQKQPHVDARMEYQAITGIPATDYDIIVESIPLIDK
jgi:hypothetical protein